MIDLLLLGSGAMVPLPDRWLSALLVRHQSELILFDCGEGTQISWRNWGWGFRKVSTIVLSHLHADHVTGLPGLLHTIGHSGRTETLNVLGPEGTGYVVDGLLRVAADLPFEVNVHEMSGGNTVASASGLQIQAFKGDHGVPCLIYRVSVERTLPFLATIAAELGVPVSQWGDLKQGKRVTVAGRLIEPQMVLGDARRGVSFGFMTDTRPPAGIAQFLSGVDLLVAEGTFGPDSDQEKARLRHHMTFSEAATIARDAAAGALWLTHFSVAMDQPEAFLSFATDIFPASTIGYAGLQRTLAFPVE